MMSKSRRSQSVADRIPIGAAGLLSKAVADGAQIGNGSAPIKSPPLTNRGGTQATAAQQPRVEHPDTGEDQRQRVNLSLSPEVKGALDSLAGLLGLSVGQVALMGLLAGLPQVADRAAVVQGLLKAK